MFYKFTRYTRATHMRKTNQKTKTNGLCVTPGTSRSWPDRTPWAQSPDQLHQLCGAATRPSRHFFFHKWEDVFSFLGAPISRPLLKDKLRPEESQEWQIASICRRPYLLKRHQKIFMNLTVNLTGGNGKKNMSDRALKSDGRVSTVWGPRAEGALAPPTSCPLAYTYTLSKPLIYFLKEYRSGLNIKFSPDQQIRIRTILNKAAVAHRKKNHFIFFCRQFVAAGWSVPVFLFPLIRRIAATDTGQINVWISHSAGSPSPLR